MWTELLKNSCKFVPQIYKTNSENQLKRSGSLILTEVFGNILKGLKITKNLQKDVTVTLSLSSGHSVDTITDASLLYPGGQYKVSAS